MITSHDLGVWGGQAGITPFFLDRKVSRRQAGIQAAWVAAQSGGLSRKHFRLHPDTLSLPSALGKPAMRSHTLLPRIKGSGGEAGETGGMGKGLAERGQCRKQLHSGEER